jgi:prevent-host-death family protein
MNDVEKAVTEARKEFADLVNRVAYTGERVALTRRGKVMAALVSAEDLELLENLRAERLDLSQRPAAAPPETPRPAPGSPLRVAAEYRPGGPPRPPGFTR